MTYDEAENVASRDDKFRATVYAMNSLLIHKGIYTKDEFRRLFIEWVERDQRKQERTTAAIPSSYALRP